MTLTVQWAILQVHIGYSNPLSYTVTRAMERNVSAEDIELEGGWNQNGNEEDATDIVRAGKKMKCRQSSSLDVEEAAL